MKRLPAALAVSLVTNLLLAAAWWSAPPSSSEAPSAVDSTASASSALPAPAPPPPPPQNWTDLTAGLTDDPADDAQLVERLRAAHFDDDAIRVLLTRRIKERYIDREVAVIQSQPRPEYWRANYYATLRGPLESRAALRRLRVEQNAQLDALLGPKAESAADIRARERRFGPIPRETADKLKDLLADYRDLAAEARADMRGFMLPTDREDLDLIEAARLKDLSELLTPEQLEGYLLRSGPVGSRLRQSLTDFAPTEAEFLTLYALQKDFDEQWGTPISGLSSEQRRARSQAQKELKNQIAEALGPERYTDYEELTSYQYRFVKQLTERLNLPAENARGLSHLEQDAVTQMRAISADPNLSPAAKRAQQLELQRQVRDTLEALLTEVGRTAYEESGIGRWVASMVPPERNPNGGGD